MSSDQAQQLDALLLLRAAIYLKKNPLLTKTSSPSKPEDVTDDIVEATHLEFNHNGHQTAALDAPTRFEISDKPINLRSIYFAFLNKDTNISDYIAAVTSSSQRLTAQSKAPLVQLPFAAKLDLNTWLDQSSDDSDYIKPLEADEQARQTAAAIGAAAGVPSVHTVGTTAATKEIDPRLREIYKGERRMGDRNSVLHGIKHTDFSRVYKYAEEHVKRSKSKQQAGSHVRAVANGPSGTPAVLASRNKPTRRVEPIIMVSPSASSLLRLSNIKSFLDEGMFMPPEMGSTEANRLQIQRSLPKIDPSRPMRFILVDSPEMFKPDYWSRVAAVFTTGQTWQFKSYKWQSPPDLFSHALGIYVGWRGDTVPSVVQGWGRGVLKVEIDKYQGPAQNRWRDREEVERVWSAIQDSMISKGMNRDGALTGNR
ncbi:MAG: hypothetical protein Q9159_001016 [Coniocarpon cinnabarinum]